MHRGVFVEPYFFDITLHAAVDRHNLLAYTGIIGKLYIAKAHEAACDPQACCRDYGYGDYIRQDFLATVFHIFPAVNNNL